MNRLLRNYFQIATAAVQKSWQSLNLKDRNYFQRTSNLKFNIILTNWDLFLASFSEVVCHLSLVFSKFIRRIVNRLDTVFPTIYISEVLLFRFVALAVVRIHKCLLQKEFMLRISVYNNVGYYLFCHVHWLKFLIYTLGIEDVV